MTMAPDKSTNDLPMTPEDMSAFLVRQTGKPCVLREEGTDEIQCPYCGETHYHPDAHGHYRASCADTSDVRIQIGYMSFNPAYGYTIFAYKKIISDDNVVHYQIASLE